MRRHKECTQNLSGQKLDRGHSTQGVCGLVSSASSSLPPTSSNTRMSLRNWRLARATSIGRRAASADTQEYPPSSPSSWADGISATVAARGVEPQNPRTTAATPTQTTDRAEPRRSPRRRRLEDRAAAASIRSAWRAPTRGRTLAGERGQVLRACCPNGVEARSRRDRRRRVPDGDRPLHRPGAGSMAHPGAKVAPTALTTAQNTPQDGKHAQRITAELGVELGVKS